MNILLVDDDQLITQSFKTILSSVPEFTVVGCLHNGLEALRFVQKNPCDIILMDIKMPFMDGIEACSEIKKTHPDIKIIMLTTFRDFKNIHQALHAGANGYLLKSDDLEKQITTIKSVMAHQAIISEDALKAYTKHKADQLLTKRENDCMELIANGYSNKEIASRLYIGEGTIRNTISVILDKLNLRDRTQIAIYYWQMKHQNK